MGNASVNREPTEDDIVVVYQGKYYLIDDWANQVPLSDQNSGPARAVINAGGILGDVKDPQGNLPGGYSAVVDLSAILKASRGIKTVLKAEALATNALKNPAKKT